MPDFGSFRGFGEKLVQGQTPTQLGKIGSESFAYDVDALGFFLRVTNAGGTLTNNEQDAVNQLVLDLKTANIWTLMKAIYPMVGASAAACAQNLKSASFTGTFVGGWTYASTGVRGNGSTGYLNTNLNQSAELIANNHHIALYSRTNSSTDSVDSGVTDNVNYAFNFLTLPRFGQLGLQNGSQSIGVSFTNSLGLFIGSSTSSTLSKFYKNNTTLGSSTASQTRSLFNNNIYLATSNVSTNNNPVGVYSAKEYAFSSIGLGLNDTDASNLYTAVQTFQTTLGRQV
jgi:hypothetical protein